MNSFSDTSPGVTITPAEQKAVDENPSWAKRQKDMLKADLSRLQSNPASLGLSDPEKKKMIGDATAAANAQQQAQVSQLGQQALAGGGLQAGALRQAQVDVATKAGDAAVGASANVEDLNSQLIQKEADRIRGELDAARERARENTRFWSTFAINGVSALIGALTGNPASPMAMSGAPDSAGSVTTPATTATTAIV